MAKKKPLQLQNEGVDLQADTANNRIGEIEKLLDGVADIESSDFYKNVSAILMNLSKHIKHNGSKGIHLDNVSVVLSGAAREVDKIARKALKI